MGSAERALVGRCAEQALRSAEQAQCRVPSRRSAEQAPVGRCAEQALRYWLAHQRLLILGTPNLDKELGQQQTQTDGNTTARSCPSSLSKFVRGTWTSRSARGKHVIKFVQVPCPSSCPSSGSSPGENSLTLIFSSSGCLVIRKNSISIPSRSAPIPGRLPQLARFFFVFSS